jgi:hypothetical protein
MDQVKVRTSATGVPVASGLHAVFSHAGSLTVSTSPPWYWQIGVVLKTVHCALGSVGTTDSIISIRKNGTIISSVTIPANDFTVEQTVTVSFQPEDELTVAIATIGNGARGLVVQGRI